MDFIKWWLKSIKWKENIIISIFMTVFISLIIFLTVPGQLIDKYLWAKIVVYSFLSICFIITIFVLYFGIKNYFDIKKIEYEIEKEDKQ